jgi:HK97 family phage major capsid protein/HK97 family phage prohead protease
MASEVEVRHVPSGLRAESSGAQSPRLAGLAIATGVPSEDLGGFREVIAPAAVRAALAATPDLVALRDHDRARVLGRVSAKTLRVHLADDGLRFEIDPPEHARDLVESVARGDVTGASFSFTDAVDAWDLRSTPPVRTITSFRLREISAGVLFPAYPSAYTAALRSLDTARAQETPPMPAPAVVITDPTPDPTPPVPPIPRTVPDDDVEVRVLGRGDSFRSWVAERTKYPADYGRVRLGDVLRAMITGPRNDVERRVLSEGTDSAGGFTVPDILLSRWIDRLRNALVIARAGAVTVPLTSDVTKIARLLSDPVAQWRAENAAVAESDPAFEAVTFTPRSLDVFTKVSRELVEDSVNAAEMIEASLVRSFAVEVDRVCLYGVGAVQTQPVGLRVLTGVNEISQGAAGAALADYDPIIDLLAMLWADNVTDVNTAIMAPRTLSTISKFKESTTDAPLARPPMLADWRFLSTANVPVNETQGAATDATSLFLGDWSQMMLGFRTEMQVEVARELFRGNYQFAYFGHLRMDMQVAHAASFGRLIGIIPG